MYVINPFRVELNVYVLIPGLSLRSNPSLKLANAFGVFVQKQNDAYSTMYSSYSDSFTNG